MSAAAFPSCLTDMLAASCVHLARQMIIICWGAEAYELCSNGRMTLQQLQLVCGQIYECRLQAFVSMGFQGIMYA